MQAFICTTCGTQYPPSELPPEHCTICEEERQYVNPAGQSWTTLEEMRDSKRYSNEFVMEESGLFSLTTQPKFAIGQTTFQTTHDPA